MRGGRAILSGLAGLALACAALSTPERAPAPPHLVLQITVDQLRGDLPTRFRDRLGDGGFRYLLEQGTHYANAHYRHANTETAVGHATLATGADPIRHGIVSNDWYDESKGRFVYCTEDLRHHILGAEPRPRVGVSPQNLLASTFGDELVVSGGGRSRVFSVSVKDRGAILPGGHAGKAFWFSRSRGEFVTSSYYYDEAPPWLSAWNQKKLPDSHRGGTWNLLHPRETYLAADRDDRPFEADLRPLGRTFPHDLGDGKLFYLLLSLTPLGDELTLDFAKTVIEKEELGQPGGPTDFLAVSFSSTDYVGHLFGPSSLEAEDNLLRLDRILADLFDFVDEKVGLENTLIVLSSDHGGPEAPEYMAGIGLTTGRFPFDYFRKPNPVSNALERRYGRDDLIAAHSHPYLTLDEGAVADAGLDLAEVERFVADEAMKIPGIAYAASRSAVREGGTPTGPILRRIRRSFHPKRSGHVYLVPDQYWFLHSTDEGDRMGIGSIAAIHGSPWAYDTWVPIFVAGHRVPAGTVYRRVGPQDIAPTLSAYLEVKPPSGSSGELLVEVLPPR